LWGIHTSGGALPLRALALRTCDDLVRFLRSFVPQAASFIWSVDLGFPLLTGGLVAQGEPMVHVRIDQAF
jgi:hypothetical protein